MTCQTMLAGMKFSITGTPNSHVYIFLVSTPGGQRLTYSAWTYDSHQMALVTGCEWISRTLCKVFRAAQSDVARSVKDSLLSQ